MAFFRSKITRNQSQVPGVETHGARAHGLAIRPSGSDCRIVGSVESRRPVGENKSVTARTFINFRGPQALLDKQETGVCLATTSGLPVTRSQPVAIPSWPLILLSELSATPGGICSYRLPTGN
jgi:hypothetical protein